jgi:serine/threonine protein kinase
MIEKHLIDVENYVINKNPEHMLGQGAFGKVFKGADKNNNYEEVAVKMIPISRLSTDEKLCEALMRELEILKTVKAEHAVQLIDVKRTSNNIYLIMELCDGGDLDKKMKEMAESNLKFSVSEACSIVKQIASVFEHLKHDQNHPLIHRDIKPSNILYQGEIVKLADFGLSKFVSDSEEKMKHSIGVGTPLYMAPEIMVGQNYNEKVDIWSLGVVFYRLLFGIEPWRAPIIQELYDRMRKDPIVIKGDISEDVENLLRGMLTFEESKRFSWTKVMNHPALAIKTAS